MVNEKKTSKKKGLPPGSVVYIGKKNTKKCFIDLIDYTSTEFIEKKKVKIEDCMQYKDKPSVTWLNVTGIHDTKLIESIGKTFDIHPLILEDIANTNQRPKIDDHNEFIFIVARMLTIGKNKNIQSEQLSFLLGRKFLITFQEDEGDIFEILRDRIRNAKGRIRKEGTDFLCYTLLDAIVDHYYVLLESIDEELEKLDQDVTKNPKQQTLGRLQIIKRELIILKRSTWPLREVVSKIIRSEHQLIRKTTVRYLSDVYDHIVQINETIESFLDISSSLLNVYLSSLSNKMNQVMKVLTIISTIFIPLTFIVGVYGMNFQFMPELHYKWSYPLLWVIMISLAAGMLILFRRKDWI